MKICMQNMKRIDCNVAMWRLDDVGVLILFIMVNKKSFASRRLAKLLYIALLCFVLLCFVTCPYMGRYQALLLRVALPCHEAVWCRLSVRRSIVLRPYGDLRVPPPYRRYVLVCNLL